MIAFLLGVFLFLIGIELILKFLGAIFGTVLFTILVVIIVLKNVLSKK